MEQRRHLCLRGVSFLAATMLLISPVGAKDPIDVEGSFRQLEKELASTQLLMDDIAAVAKGHRPFGKRLAAILDKHVNTTLAVADSVRPPTRPVGPFSALVRRAPYDHGFPIERSRDHKGSLCHRGTDFALGPDPALRMNLEVTWQGVVPRDAPYFVLVGLERSSKKARYKDAHDVQLKVGKKTLRPPTSYSASDVLGEAYEQIDVKLSDEDLMTLVNATSVVEGRIGSDNFRITRAQISALHDMMTLGLRR